MITGKVSKGTPHVGNSHMRCRKAICVLAVVASCIVTAFGEAPIVEFAGYINGVMNIWATNSVAPASRVIQMKQAGADDSQYVDVAFSHSTYTDNGKNKFDAYYLATNWAGTASFRIANVDGDGVRTYASAGDFTASFFLKPVAYPVDTYHSTCPGSNMTDGKVATYSDAISQGSGMLVVFDMGTERTVGAVRWVHRRFSSNLDRTKNAVLEYSDTPDFSGNVTTVFTFPGASDPFPQLYGKIYEQVLDTPVRARYFRYCPKNSTFGSIAELELVPSSLADVAIDAPDWSYSDITNCFPVLTGHSDARFAVSSILQRASSADGVFRNVGNWVLGTGDVVFTNDLDRVGKIGYYRLCTMAEFPGYAPEFVYGPSTPVARGRRLDRNWGDEASLLRGISVMAPFTDDESVNSESELKHAVKAFDGNPSTFPDISPSNPAIGLDFGIANVHVAGVRVFPRSTLEERINYTQLYIGTASDMSDGTEVFDFAKKFTKGTYEIAYFDVTPNSEPCRYVWMKADKTGYHAWYGNVNELQIFGWTDEDTRKASVSGAIISFR